jgi:hypothetical protein
LERNMSSPPLRKQRNKRGESGGGVLWLGSEHSTFYALYICTSNDIHCLQMPIFLLRESIHGLEIRSYCSGTQNPDYRQRTSQGNYYKSFAPWIWLKIWYKVTS